MDIEKYKHIFDDCEVFVGRREKGGQHVGVDPTVTITHKSGLTAIVDCSNSSYKNRTIAFDMILSGLTHKDF